MLGKVWCIPATRDSRWIREEVHRAQTVSPGGASTRFPIPGNIILTS